MLGLGWWERPEELGPGGCGLAERGILLLFEGLVISAGHSK